MPSATREITIQAPVEACMKVITDFEAYPSFLPEMTHVEVLREGIEGSLKWWEAAFTLSVIRELHYTLRLEQTGPDHLTWSLVEGPFQINAGSWTLAAQESGATMATYQIEMQVGMFVPGSIVRGLVDQSLPSTLQRFKSAIEGAV